MYSKGYGETGHFLVLGGARSGKSAYALDLAHEITREVALPRRLFIATSRPGDDEMLARIEAHKRERGEDWQTVEEEIGIDVALREKSGSFDVAVIDCITMWISNMLLECPDELAERLDGLVHALSLAGAPIILVSNEVGLGIVPDNALARQFRDVLGRANQRLAAVCSQVIFMVAGIATTIKGRQVFTGL